MQSLIAWTKNMFQFSVNTVPGDGLADEALEGICSHNDNQVQVLYDIYVYIYTYIHVYIYIYMDMGLPPEGLTHWPLGNLNEILGT